MIALAFIAGILVGPYLLFAFVSFASDSRFCHGEFTTWQMLWRAVIWPIQLVIEAWNE